MSLTITQRGRGNDFKYAQIWFPCHKWMCLFTEAASLQELELCDIIMSPADISNFLPKEVLGTIQCHTCHYY